MNTPNLLVLMMFVFLTTTPIAPAQQIDQGILAQMVLEGTAEEQHRAIATAERLGPAQTGILLRAALIQALQHEGDRHARRYWAERRGETLPSADPEATFALVRTVAALEDPAAIPALISALGRGGVVRAALMGFGSQRILPGVLQSVTSVESPHYVVTDALTILRWIAEGPDASSVSPGLMQRVRAVAEQRLMREQYFTTLWSAIDLAIALQDAGLRAIVQSLASDRDAVIARGITDAGLITETQRRATARLAGEPALPRCC